MGLGQRSDVGEFLCDVLLEKKSEELISAVRCIESSQSFLPFWAFSIADVPTPAFARSALDRYVKSVPSSSLPFSG